jgi:hypothetical protein
MNSKILALQTLLLLLCIFFLLSCEDESILNSPNSNSLKKIFVDCNSKTFEFGTEDYPFRDINKALTAAAEGSVLIVASGEYEVPNGGLQLKAGVGIEGEDSYTTIIKGDLIDYNNSSLPISVINIRFNNLNFNRPLFSSNAFSKFEIRNCICNSIDVRFDRNNPAYPFFFYIINNIVAEKIYLHHGDGFWSNLNYIKNNWVSGGIFLENGKRSIVYVDSNHVDGIIRNTSSVETETYLRFNYIQGRIIDSLEYWTDWASNIIYKNKIFYHEYFPESALSAIQHHGASIGILDNQINVLYGSGINLVVDEYVGIERNTIHIEHSNPNTDSSKYYYGMKIISNKCEIKDNIVNGGDFGIYLNSASSFVDENQIYSNLGFYLNSNGDFQSNHIISLVKEALIIDGASGKYFNNEFNGKDCSVRIIKAKNQLSHGIIDFGGGMLSSSGNNSFNSETSFNMIVESNYTDVETIYAKYNKWNHQTEQEIDILDIYDGNDQAGLSIVSFVPFIEQ